jgi:hypothetical protein
MDGNLIELLKPLRRAQFLADKQRVQVFEIRQTNKQGDVGFVRMLPLELGCPSRHWPLSCRIGPCSKCLPHWRRRG